MARHTWQEIAEYQLEKRTNTMIMQATATRKFHGVKRAIGEMPRYNRHDGAYLEVHYDVQRDCVYTNYHVSFGHNSWTIYHDANIIRVGMYDARVTMQQLREDIKRAIACLGQD